MEQEPADNDLEFLDDDSDHAGDRREVFEVLSRGEPLDAPAVKSAFEGAIRDDGKFAAPTVLVAGELELPFDEAEVLKATVAAAKPLATTSDEDLNAALTTASELLEIPDLSSTPEICVDLTKQLRVAFARCKNAVQNEYLEARTNRALLSSRRYQKRLLFGGTHLRFRLWPPEAEDAVPQVGYFPEELAEKLPMFRRFQARVLVTVNVAEDESEKQRYALRALALARVTVIRADD